MAIVSVILLCFNQEKTVAKAIESVLREDSSVPFEIVIGDDASHDSTRAICREYADRYPSIIRLLPEAPNLGLVGNYFRCLEACRGEYITDCAGDDEWIGNHRLSTALSVFRDNPDVNVVYSGYIIRDIPSGTTRNGYADKSRGGGITVTKGRDILKMTLNRKDSLPYLLSAAVYRAADIKEALRENPDMVCNEAFGVEDVPVIAALASKGDAAYNPDITLCYNVLEESVSHSSDRTRSARFYLKSLYTSRMLGRHYRLDDKEMADIFASRALYVASAAFDTADSALSAALEKELEEWSLKRPLKVRCYLWMMRLPAVHRLAMSAKRIINRISRF